MIDLQHAITQLKSMIPTLRGLLASIDESQAQWRPAPDKWSILDVINHLADEERTDFRQRLDLTLHSPGQEWPGIDPDRTVAEPRYRERSLREGLEDFVAERETSLAWLKELDVPDWNIAYSHPVYGPIHAGTLLLSWVGHDLLHIRQITRLRWEYLQSGVGEYTLLYAGEW